LHALLAGLDDTAAAAAANVQRPTLNRWKNHDADFISAMNIARRDLAAGFLDGLRALYGDAVAVIRDGLDAEQPIAIRLRAAEAIRARWATKHAEVAREQDTARFLMPLSSLYD
jgi:hypothetical protein